MKYNLLYIYLLTSILCFGQNTISKEVLITNQAIELPGTLSYNKTNSPLIIWIHGSGNVDRNGNQGTTVRANYIKQFRDQINKKGMAFFSYDKRTANPKNFPLLTNIVFTDLVDDADKVIRHFKNDPRFSEIVLVGHSQGSLITMLLSEKYDKFISLAGPSNTVQQTIINQISKQDKALGNIAAAHFKELLETGTVINTHPLLATIFAPQNQKFIINYAQYNPTKEIKKLKIPSLIINGTKDLQVSIEEAKKLNDALPSSKLVLINNMNHVLKNIEKDTDNMNSYYTENFKLSSKLITTIVAFLKN